MPSVPQESLERRLQFEADSLARLTKASQKYIALMLLPDQVQRAATQTLKRIASGRKESVSKYEVLSRDCMNCMAPRTPCSP